MFHLPDLPNVGYSTTNEKTGSDQIMLFIRSLECDREDPVRGRDRLLTIVIDGREKWRTHARAAFGTTMHLTDDKLDEMYHYLTLLAAKPRDQWRLLQADKAGNMDRWRDIVREIMPDIEQQREHVRLMAKWRP